MRQSIVLVIVALAIVFSVVAFAVPFEWGVGFWLAYGFGMVAIGSQLYFLPSAFKRGGTPKSKVYGFPIARLGVIYLVVQLCLSIVAMLLGSMVPFWVWLIADAIVLLLALIGGVAVEEARTEVTRQDAAVAANIAAIEELRFEAQMIVARCANAEIRPIVERVSEALRFSDPVSNARTVMLEQRLASDLSLLCAAVSANDSAQAHVCAEKTLSDIGERNAMCRLGK